MKRLRTGSRVGKYRINRVLGSGGFATVFQAVDQVEGVTVALKVPHAHLLGSDVEESLGKEIRIAARLEHPNVVTPRNAMVVDGRLVIAYPLGDETLAERMGRRMAADRAVDFAAQMIAGLAYAHGKKIIHCDVKPENFVIFEETTVRLTDFGISRAAAGTLRASGSGTVGYMAPEQAMGRPSFRSDVFSMGLVCYRLFAGALPEWPFEHPFPREDRIRRNHSPRMLAFLRRAISVEPRRRFADAVAMQAAFESAREKSPRRAPRTTGVDWRTVRARQFFAAFGEPFPRRVECGSCGQTVGETMQWCPWCGDGISIEHPRHGARSCERCGRGVNSDWRYCPWCWGAAIAPATTRRTPDRRAVARCANPDCRERCLMPFMRYCPHCHAAVKRTWKLAGERAACGGCGHGVARDFWDYCAWCGRGVERR